MAGGANDSAVRIEIALRAGMMAKAALELIGGSVGVARLRLVEVAKQMRELDEYLKKHNL